MRGITMNIEVINGENNTTLELTGRLESSTAPILQEKLMAQIETGMDICLDFKELQYVSSAGLRILLMGEKAAKSKDITMKIINVSADIMEVFEMTGFSNILKIEVGS